MGISYSLFLDMTWKEYDYYYIGYHRRIERQWDYTRHIIASNYNSSGFSRKSIKATDIMKLSLLDTVPDFKKMDKDEIEGMMNAIDIK